MFLRRLWLLWLCALLLLIAVAILPVSTRLTRITAVILAVVVWFGGIGLVWRRPVARIVLLVLTAAVGVFFMLPDRPLPPQETLRSDYVTGLGRYEGSRYYWGGENRRGIDCSGLIRRGLIDSMMLRGLREFHPTLARAAVRLWWNDCTAAALGKPDSGLTQGVTKAESINALDHRPLKPGDLAVTSSGAHILAYVGDETWIEADPLAGRVIRVKAKVSDNAWLTGPVTITRWTLLAGE